MPADSGRLVMGFVQVRDHALWSDDIHGDTALQQRIRDMREGETIELKVEGITGTWRRLRDGAGGRTGPGVQAEGLAQSKWHELRNERRGGLATVEVCE